MPRRNVLTLILCAFGMLILLGSAVPLARAEGPAPAPEICTVSKNWLVKGNCGMVAGTKFVGTTDNQALVFKTNKIEQMRILTNGNIGIGTTSPSSRLSVAGTIQSTNGGIKFPDGTTQTTAVASGNFVKKNGDSMTGRLILQNNGLWVGTEQLVLAGGKVGVGTSIPAQTLEVDGISSFGEPGGVYAYLFNAGNLGYYPTIGFNTYGAPVYRAGDKGYGGLWQFQNNDGKLIYYTGTNVSAGQAHAFTPALTIDNEGRVGIGTTPDSTTFQVKGDGSYASFEVDNQSGHFGLLVGEDNLVQLGTLDGSSTTHACFHDATFHIFAACGSAAEYVPSIDAGVGFPETADLVSIAPAVANPYSDTHGPFTVQKSTSACDTNLLGFIVKAESGADGVKLNDHYLPLAIYGYFPAKVTLENGVIHRGDALTSSSKAGYAMKATDACKIIGYALEDANSEGQIQVFANHGDSSASEVVSLRSKVDELTQENSELKQENETMKQELAAIEARLDALENGMPKVQASNAGGNANAQ